ncbi:hypothetical protein CWI38_0037p0020 [Hamiltosporidium tvaerminnensis]|uniref:Uncharacterized protein n=1 Tax=Hamiltosporidium tvaerminnensis TaxID=1176355 RepID=A0A4Q9M3T0_9MICR|nr:hypothetical protein CWI38_0037p0020 [Hamiltosporidium tvaerminnensis]
MQRTPIPSTVEFKSEHMLQLLDCLEKHKDTSTRRAAILKVENNNKTHLSPIKNFLKIKYGLEEEVTKKKLEEAQLANLYNEIKNRKLHSKLYNARNNELVSVNDSSRCLKKGSVKLRMCQHCNQSRKTVDHLATRCEKMLVVRCIHLILLNKYKFWSLKRIRSHSVQEILDNEYAEIRVVTRIKTDVKIRCNRQDIYILDKKHNRITLIELRKYDLLANELGFVYKCSVEIIPYVMTWDGIVTKYYKTYVRRLQIPMNVEAYIQFIVLKKTRASLSVILRAEMHKQPIPPLKQVENEEDDEPTTNTNEELEFKKEIEVVKMVEIIM